MNRQAWFEELYRAHADRVHAYALRRSSPSAAEDVVSEVFLTAWRRRREVPAEPLPWLVGVARRVLANRRRGEGRAAALHARLAEAERPGHVVADDDGGAGARVVQALSTLGDGDRELLLVIAWDGLEPAEAAEALGVRAGPSRCGCTGRAAGSPTP